MQVKFLAAALFAAFPLIASAQSSVVVYGVIDAAVAREDTGAPDGSRSVVNSGNQSTSRFGFKGTEDIGTGLKAVFNVEGGFVTDTGMGDTALFGRRAVVGLQGSFGSIMIGREYTPIADVAKESDIFGQGFHGTNLGAFGSSNTRLTRRISNSMNYKSVPMSGFKFAAAFGDGEVAVGPSNDLLGVSAEYTVGGLYLGAGYHTVERVLAGKDKEMMVGAGYKMGSFAVKGNWMAADPDGANKFTQINLGASYAMNANTFYLNLQRNKLTTGDASGRIIALAYSYAFSKRTNVYASYARMTNNATGAFGIVSAGTSVNPVAAGQDPSNLSLGVRHSF
jgi:predicted porin